VPILFGHTTFDLGSCGYAQAEFFVEGSADAYAPTSALTTDGRWTVQPSSQAAYKTRVVVNRPIDDRDFNGTVIVEWLNVSGGVDASPDSTHTHTHTHTSSCSGRAMPGSVYPHRPGDSTR
jgi:hypothetical protein